MRITVLRLWQAANGALSLRLGSDGSVYGVASFSPDGRLLAAAGHWPRLWELATGREASSSRASAAGSNVVFSPDGRWLVFGDLQGIVHLWDSSSGAEVPGPRGG